MAIDLSALDQFSINDLTLEVKPMGKPLELPLADVMEDPNQPRHFFSEEALHELAASIQETGVKSPISVRPAPDGKYLINHGARRYRASLLAGKLTIPAFVDTSHDDYDKAIENIQRENLTPLEIARFIGRRVAAGDKQADIARRLGKPKSFVSEHAALLEAPDYIQVLCESGRCTDIRTLYLLLKAHEEFPDQVVAFVDNAGSLARSDVNRLMQWLKQEREREHQPGTPTEDDPLDTAPKEEDALPPAPERVTLDPAPIDRVDQGLIAPPQEPAPPRQATLVVRYGGRLAYLVLPSEVEIRYQDTGEQTRVPAETVDWLTVAYE